MTDKVEINDQPEKNTVMTQQNIKQNMMSAIPQAQANAVRGLRKDQVDQSQAEYKAQELATSRMSEVLYANDGGAAIMRLNELSADPGQMKLFMQRIGESKQMAQGTTHKLNFNQQVSTVDRISLGY